MIVTITQFRTLARDEAGNVLPLGKDRTATQARTTVGAFTALAADTSIIRLATDTAIHMDIEGGSTNTSDELFMPGVEYLAVDGGEVLTIAAIA